MSDPDCLVVRFKITDKDSFEPMRRKFLNSLSGVKPLPGAVVDAVASDDIFRLDRYVEYLRSCIDNRRLEVDHILDQEEWANNGQPKMHDTAVQYKYSEEFE